MCTPHAFSAVHCDGTKFDSNLEAIPAYPITDLSVSAKIVANPNAGELLEGSNVLRVARYVIIRASAIDANHPGENAIKTMTIALNIVVVTVMKVVIVLDHFCYGASNCIDIYISLMISLPKSI